MEQAPTVVSGRQLDSLSPTRLGVRRHISPQVGVGFDFDRSASLRLTAMRRGVMVGLGLTLKFLVTAPIAKLLSQTYEWDLGS